VVFFHFTARRYEILPYGSLVEGPPWNLGWVGVNLFFIISGYVVSHTLLKSSNAKDFILKRITRIYPALWLILPIVFLVQKYIPYSIFEERSLLPNLLGSLTLIPPSVLNIPNVFYFDWLTLVLWSLKVEMCFYFLCYILFNYFPYQKIVLFSAAIGTLTSIFLIVTYNLNIVFVQPIVSVLEGLGFEYLPWFILGMLFYEQKVMKNEKNLMIVLFSGFALAISGSKNNFSLDQIGEFAVIALFITVVFGKMNLKFIKLKIFQRLGFSSYEMYLIHQGVGFPILFFLVKKFDLTSTESFLLMLIIVSIMFTVSLYLSKITLRINSKFRDLLIKG
jgi:peptidoglycan/LPS O-acetylase OafA/YrhL